MNANNNNKIDTPEVSILQRPVLSYKVLQKANLVSCYMLNYLPLYSGSVETFLKHCHPVILLVEGLVYHADKQLEAAQRGEIPYTGLTSWLEMREIIVDSLKKLNLYDQLVEELLDNINKYWTMENQIMYDGQLSPDLLSSVIQIRPCDIILLHHLAHRALNMPYNKEEFEILKAFEIRGEIEYDFIEYKGDVKNDDYNTYRMFVRLYGEEAPNYVRLEVERWTTILRERISRLPEERRAIFQKIFDDYIVDGPLKSPVPIPEPILEPELA